MANDSQSGNLTVARMCKPRPRFRYYVGILAILACVTGLWVSFDDARHGQASAAIVFGSVSLAAALILAQTLRRELSLIADHVSTTGVVTETRPTTRGGSHISYRFEALDGKQYEAESDWSVRSLKNGERVALLYRTLQPETSRPLPNFIFFAFEDASKT